jgi:hypothetical protein
MEASEQPEADPVAQPFTLRQVHPALLLKDLSREQRASGFARLDAMVNSVLPRLLSGEPQSRPRP